MPRFCSRICLGASLLSSVLLSACVTRARIAAAEREVLAATRSGSPYELADVAALTAAAAATGEAYLGLSDRIATQEDVAALALILGAGVVAHEAAAGAGAGRLARVALPGVAANRAAVYLRPRDGARVLLRAAARQGCIASASLRYAHPTEARESESFRRIADAMFAARLRLREELTRGDLPDATETVVDYGSAIRALINASHGANRPSETQLLDAALTACLDPPARDGGAHYPGSAGVNPAVVVTSRARR
ncbi:hypothetical protein EKE94_01370 [Mesobaculum littorinae]|uniref:Lipoprotein n=1 Tax=Mesobaculum littorinae TaxID=2486419 RepID=A0A438AKL8_9RHOB|nr:hypothetical protein [Mesobaculum littorinae]RVV99371.1 hypothetical protein EKE94_01370 [Mesobaculum littorinae]